MNCDSCGMSIEAGPYCQHCADETGVLKDFEEMFERFVQWTLSQGEAVNRTDAEGKTKTYMKSMPAWQGHPSLKNI
ncbi:MAG: hypothetical protein JKY49_04390 [Cohaesibacteraceae bacterium]|nr:hypothetical protein [Cohaesibacteraceae bacterium]MBL4877006.1 hypothetical protein [Cohaesibacteraceae bacterium]